MRIGIPGSQAIVEQNNYIMRWRRQNVGVLDLEAAGAAMVEQACMSMHDLSKERHDAVQFTVRVGELGAFFMQHACPREEDRRNHQIWRRFRSSEANRTRAEEIQPSSTEYSTRKRDRTPLSRSFRSSDAKRTRAEEIQPNTKSRDRTPLRRMDSRKACERSVAP